MCVCARTLAHVCVPFWNRYYTLTLQVNCTFPRKLISHCNITIIQKKKKVWNLKGVLIFYFWIVNLGYKNNYIYCNCNKSQNDQT